MAIRRKEFSLNRVGGILKIFGSVAALAVSFFLGIMVGKNDIKGFPGLEKEVKSDVIKMKIESAPVELSPVTATSNTEKAVTTENVISKPEITFYDTLAKPEKNISRRENAASRNYPGADNSGGKVYAIQTGAMKDRSLADAAVSKLKKKGYSAYISSSESSGKVTWYRVRLGTFSNREEASTEARKIEKNEGISATVVEK